MPSGFKKGDWLVTDQESGLIRYASEVLQDFQGLYVTNKWADHEQPQDFVKPGKDPRPLPFYSPLNFPTTISSASAHVGATNVPVFPYGIRRLGD